MTRDPGLEERYHDPPPAWFRAARCLLEILKTLLVGGVGENREKRDEIGHTIRTRNTDVFNQWNSQSFRPVNAWAANFGALRATERP
jgi:hypothetical protein